MKRISLIIPVYNRPEEVEELLATLAAQTSHGFEVVIVEDGSSITSREAVERYSGRLDISYLYQENGGPASARNTGAAKAKGDFLVFMDSDCLVPPDYFAAVQRHIDGGGPENDNTEGVRFYGGADSAAPDFSPLQKAVSYSMTSLFTTGGIRGNSRKSGKFTHGNALQSGKFTPRSFNLGIDKELFRSVGGFADMRIGEDIDFSNRVAASGVKPVFLADATVCHKRRTSMRLFFKQVFVFGTARVNLDLRHPRSRKAVFYLPALFTLGSAALVICAVLWAAIAPPQCRIYALWSLAPFVLLMLLWFADSAVRNGSLRIGWLSIWTSFIQLYGYGLGFLYGTWMRRIRRLPEKDTYKVTRFFSQKTR